MEIKPEVYAMAVEIPADGTRSRGITAFCFLKENLREAREFCSKCGYKASEIIGPLNEEQEKRAVEVLKQGTSKSLDSAVKHILGAIK